MAKLSDGVSGRELQRYLEGITREVRLSGTPEEARAFDWIEAELAKLGYQTTRYSTDALIGYPLESSIVVTSHGSKPLTCNGNALVPATGPAGIEAELVHVGLGLEPADYAGRDVRGKVALTHGIATPEAVLEAARQGAVAQVFVNGPHIHEMCVGTVWGTPDPGAAHLLPSIPTVGIGGEDGEWLLAQLATGPVTCRIQTEVHRAWTPIPTLVADLPGQGSDLFTMFSGHVDSWFYGVMDNGTANATQMEVGRLLAERKADLRHGIRLAFWSGHSHGRYAGSTWYADHAWQDLHDRCAVHVNIDSVGGRNATTLTDGATMAETYGYARRVLQESVGADLNYRRIGRSSDQSFWGHGIPSLLAGVSEQSPEAAAEDSGVGELFGGGGFGWWWHTPEDTLDKIDPEFLVRDARIYADALWGLVGEDRLPVDPAAGAREMAEALARYARSAPAELALGDLAGETDRLSTAIEAANIPAKPAGEGNALVMALCRDLVPVNYTRNGPFHHDLALGTAPVPGLSDAAQLANLPAGSDEWHFTVASLRRHRNRVAHAVRQAADRLG